MNKIIGFRASSDTRLVQDRLHQHWLSLIQPDEDMPRASTFDPLDVPFALGSLTVVEVVDQRDFVIRLLATNIQSRLSKPVAGTRLRDFPEPERARVIVAAHEECFRERRPTHFDSDVTEFNVTRSYRARLWPFMDDAGRVSRIIACRAVLTDTKRSSDASKSEGSVAGTKGFAAFMTNAVR